MVWPQEGVKKRVLLISHYFPPLNQIGGLRLAFWAKYLSREGYLVDVITSDKRNIPEPKDINFSFPDGVGVYEVPADLPGLVNFLKKADATAALGGSENAGSFAKSVLKGARGVALKLLGSLATPTWFYMGAFLRTARELMAKRDYDVLITSYSPGVTHLVGYWLKRRQPSLIWLADFRDPWFDNQIASASPPFSLLEKFLERLCANSTDILTVVSDAMKEIYRARYPQKCVVTLPNGFDPDEHLDWKERLLSVQNVPWDTSSAPNVEILYTGTIYPGYQDPTPLLRALRSLRSQHPGEQIKVVFVGARAFHVLELAQALGVQDSVEYLGHVPRNEAIALQKRSSALLLLGNPHKKSNFVLTGKIFEYLVSGRPILALGFSDDSEIARLLREWGVGINCGTDERCIQGFLDTLLRLGYWPDYKPNIEAIENFSYEKIIKKLIGLLEGGCEEN